ncbi:hypothetical protein ACFL17_01915 [Pseudomonadota bacterium]
MKYVVLEAPSCIYFVSRKELTVLEIPSVAENVVPELYLAAERAQIEISGPNQFIYYEFDGSVSRPFTLDFAIPVAGKKPYQGDFAYRDAGEFKCAARMYVGALSGLGRAWEEFAEQLVKDGYNLGAERREIYKIWDAHDSERNMTELQMEIVDN